ncbi:hypothetical protein PHYPO_G00100520 [Pangasianodon hypophthalmus]|uniref:DUF1279 domain-containing protein n=1 Tax=Pangasianodon hypophthalmus TaxID=310915 RepID=A0A5N5PWC0_PANHP|nr:hypothetical protein PHYPO_G00100520 [Pangasianodon hypophthalmus]
MFLFRGARSVVPSSLRYYNFTSSVHVARNTPRDAIWALHKSSIISSSQVRDRGADSVSVLHSGGILQDKSVKSNKYVSHPWMKREPAPQVQKVLLSTSPQGGAEKPEPEKKQNKTKELKKIFKEYGAVGVSFHIGISLISLGIFYIAVSSGINMTAVLSKLGFSESVVQSKMAAGTSTFVLAYAVHKLFAPFRISITLVSVPLIVQYLRKTGIFKSSPPRL